MYGWNSDFSIEWIKAAFPEDVELLVIENEEEIENFEDFTYKNNSESESDSDLE